MLFVSALMKTFYLSFAEISFSFAYFLRIRSGARNDTKRLFQVIASDSKNRAAISRCSFGGFLTAPQPHINVWGEFRIENSELRMHISGCRIDKETCPLCKRQQKNFLYFFILCLQCRHVCAIIHAKQ